MAGALAAILSCSEPLAFESQVATRVRVIAPADPQTVVGATYSDSVQVIVEDQRGRRLPGAAVTITALDGGVAPSTLVTGVFGDVRLAWRLGPLAGRQRLVVAIAGGSTDTLAATARAGAARVATLARDTVTFVALEDTLSLEVASAADGFGNVVSAPVIQWQSGDTTIARVTAGGQLRAVGAGTVTVTARVDSAVAPVQVRVAPVVSNVALAAPKVRVAAVGASYCVGAVPRDRNGRAVAGAAVTVTPLDTVVAGPGTSTDCVTTRALGATLLRVTSGTVSATQELRVGPSAPTRLVATDSVRFTSTARVRQLGATVFDQDTLALAGAAVTWTTADTAVLGLTPEGQATSRRQGVARVIATASGGPADTIVVLVQPVVATLTVSALPAGTIGVGDTVRVPVDARDSAGAVIRAPGVTYVSTTPSVATVSATGLVTGVSVGSTSLIVSSGALVRTVGVSVANITRWQSVQLRLDGRAACGLATRGDIYCWGDNALGSLGTGSLASRITPALVQGNQRWIQLSVGNWHTCALNDRNELFCWGLSGSRRRDGGRYAPPQGLSVDSTLGEYSAVPWRIPTPEPFRTVAVGVFHTCGIGASGTVYCWGENKSGEAGIYTTAADTLMRLPNAIPLPEAATQLAVGEQFSCAGTSDGRWWCWGDNSQGQFGDGRALATLALPVRAFQTGPNLVTVSASIGFIRTPCGLDASGAAYCWAHNSTGQMGVGAPDTARAKPIAPVQSTSRYVTIASRRGSVCAVTVEGAVDCWGTANSSVFGAATPPNACQVQSGVGIAGAVGTPFPCTATPVRLPFTQRFRTLSIGAAITPQDPADWRAICGVTLSGDAFCWGRGALGNLNVSVSAVPVPVTSP